MKLNKKVLFILLIFFISNVIILLYKIVALKKLYYTLINEKFDIKNKFLKICIIFYK